jgi:lysophospholipase
MAAMRTLHETFLGKRGVTIFWQAWLPDEKPRAVVVVAHGFGEHSGRYTNLVEAIVPKGYAVYAPDHRGHGRSEGTRALIDDYEFLLDDLDEIFKRVAHDHPGLPVFLLGHSMGGSVALASALRKQSHLRGLILSGPLVSNVGVPKALAAVAGLLGRVAPRLGVRQLGSSGVSRDPAVVAAYDADPLVFHGKMPAGTGAALVRRSAAFASQMPSLNVPLLVVHGTADQLVDVECGKTVHRLAGSTDKTLKLYDGLFHEVMNEPEKATVLADISAWLDAHR